MNTVTTVLLGAGGRGMDSYAPYALEHPERLKFVAVAEPDETRRNKFAELHGIGADRRYDSWDKLLAQPQLADACIICTQDRMHYEPTMEALKKGYHILLEKPMSNDPLECVTMGELAKKYNRIFSICHVLRYTNFFSTLKKLLDEGRIGKLMSIQHNENVGFWHQAHSFVRGNWRNSKESSPMILAKCCHDMDIMLWLAGSDCRSISSFGSLSYFRKENAPEGAPSRCVDGCPAEDECPLSAYKIYLTPSTQWPTSAIGNDMSYEGRMKAMKTGPYGRCVFHCDNDVVDHQVVNLEFENGVTAAFTMSAFTRDITRTVKLMGTKGEIRATMEKDEIEIIDFITGNTDVIKLARSTSNHAGGDYGIIHDFVRLVGSGAAKKGLTSADRSVQSHIMAFAAEKSRLEKKVVHMKEFTGELLDAAKVI